MDIHGLTHLVNILYREDEQGERIRLFYKWVNEKEKVFTLEEFSELLKMCTKEQIDLDKKRRYPICHHNGPTSHDSYDRKICCYCGEKI